MVYDTCNYWVYQFPSRRFKSSAARLRDTFNSHAICDMFPESWRGTPRKIIHFERWDFPWHKPSSDKGVPPWLWKPPKNHLSAEFLIDFDNLSRTRPPWKNGEFPMAWWPEATLWYWRTNSRKFSPCLVRWFTSERWWFSSSQTRFVYGIEVVCGVYKPTKNHFY